MRTSVMAEFPVAEFETRIAELLVRMKANGLDGMMISNRENTRYYCDLQSIIWSSKVSTPGILILNADGKMRLVGSASAVETARQTSCCNPEDVTCYNRNGLEGIPATYPDSIVAAFCALGLQKGNVGMELGEGCYLQLQLHWFEEISQKLPDVHFTDASSLLLGQRAIKSAAEIELLATACEHTEQSLRYAFENVTLGVSTENDFFRLFAQEAFRRHCENVTNDLIPLSVLFGMERFHHVGSPAGEIIIDATEHAPLQASGGLYLHGYYGNLTRVGVVGSLTDRQQAMLNAARDTTDYALSLLRDGADVAAVTEAVDRFALATPMADAYLSKGDLGFGIGLDLKEPPYLRKLAKNGGVLRTGMTLAIGPRFGNDETGLFALTQDVAITPTGIRRLNSLSGDPYIL